VQAAARQTSPWQLRAEPVARVAARVAVGGPAHVAAGGAGVHRAAQTPVPAARSRSHVLLLHPPLQGSQQEGCHSLLRVLDKAHLVRSLASVAAGPVAGRRCRMFVVLGQSHRRLPGVPWLGAPAATECHLQAASG
jgi:hypothetical protein